MKRNVSLYIAGTKVDLDDASLILFNYTKDDLSNPTAVKNSYSHNVTLKGTPTNNKLFGDIFRLDRKTLYSGKYNSVYFDPMRKTPFQIFDDMSTILESGYVKLDSVSVKGQDISYSISLYGGLGSFFYGLSYNEDGSTKNLSDLTYLSLANTRIKTFGLIPDAGVVQEAWSYLADPYNFDLHAADYNWWNIFNFIPAYNGMPENFDSNKAVISDDSFYVNFVTSKTEEGVTYGKKEGLSSALMSFTNNHTEWEVADLRWYLQRPVISVRSIFEAICYSENNGGYEVELDRSFFNDDNVNYYDGWLTLAMIKSDKRNTRDGLSDVLKSTMSPAEFLLSFAKMYGLVFSCDKSTKKVKIMSRNTFYRYSEEVVDLSQRINKKSPIQIVPIVASSKWYQFGGNIAGQFAQEYKESYARPYGIQRINTGYDFNVEISDLTKEVKFKEAVDVLEKNRMFVSKKKKVSSSTYKEVFMLPAYEEVTVQLWNNTDEKTISAQISAIDSSVQFDNPDDPYSDWLPKLQLHGSEQKAEDGSGILVVFNGMKQAPNDKSYWLTNDTTDMMDLNNGKACWNLTAKGISVKQLPMFNRGMIQTYGMEKYMRNSLEWGQSFERAIPDVRLEEGDTMYSRWWKRYLLDLFDDDTKIMKCKVDLRGLNVGQDLLRLFFWYGGSIWVLNKISNYSITTYDDAECEFIRVNDMENYTNGQQEW